MITAHRSTLLAGGSVTTIDNGGSSTIVIAYQVSRMYCDDNMHTMISVHIQTHFYW